MELAMECIINHSFENAVVSDILEKQEKINGMGLILHEFFKDKSELGLWQLSEVSDFYEKHLIFNDVEIQELSSLKGKRRLQWLGVRYLLHHMTGRSERAKVIKDAFGKPHLENSNFNISLSHTDDLVAVYASPNVVGVDIQKIEDKIIKVAPKYLGTIEADYLDTLSNDYRQKLHVIWGAKEAMYKAENRKGGSFKDNLSIDNFEFELEGITMGHLDMKGEHVDFNVFYRQIKNNILVMVVKVNS